MLQPTLKNILFFLFTKYLAYYLYFMAKHNDFRLFELKSISDIGSLFTYFAFFMLPIIILSFILFSLPIYFSFKLKNVFLFLTSLSVLLILELIIYLNGTGQKNVVINESHYFLINAFFLLFFFYKPILQKFIKNS